VFSECFVRVVTDPALTDTATLVVYLWRHEFYFWWKRGPRFLHYENGDWRSGRSRLD